MAALKLPDSHALIHQLVDDAEKALRAFPITSPFSQGAITRLMDAKDHIIWDAEQRAKDAAAAAIAAAAPQPASSPAAAPATKTAAPKA